MEEYVKKFSEYQLLNFLLSGSIFSILITRTTGIDLSFENILHSVFVYYFIGLVISRLGSLFIGPIYKKINIINFEPYQDYLSASKKDAKIDVLSQENNMYRTLIATFVLYTITFIVSKTTERYYVGKASTIIFILSLLMVVLFSFAYRKQTKFIAKRVRKSK